MRFMLRLGRILTVTSSDGAGGVRSGSVDGCRARVDAKGEPISAWGNSHREAAVARAVDD